MPFSWSKLFFRKRQRWGYVPAMLFSGTVLLGYATTFFENMAHLSRLNVTWCLVFGALFLLLGSIDLAYVCDELPSASRFGYFAAQAGLLFGILWTSRMEGEMPVCIYPLISVTVAVLDGWVAVSGVAVVYAVMLGVEDRFWGVANAERFAVSMIPGVAFVILFTLVALKADAARQKAEALSEEVERLAVIRERNRLAREIHDSLGHFLTTIHVQLQAARAVHGSDPGRAMEAVEKAQGLARDALVEVRHSVGSLKEDTALAPLAARIQELAAATDGCGVAVTLEVLGEARALPPAAEHAIFRSAQEGLTNVRKHAQARRAQVTLDYRERGRVAVSVADDGRGGTAGAGGHGLAGLRERIEALGGRVAAENSAAGGFRLQVEIPA